MQRVYYDLHIHTALSPCADNDMTPCDIIGMAIVNNLDAIAVTDHNSFANAKAVCEASKGVCAAHGRGKEVIVLPGAEVTTAEEVHVLCLFDNCERASCFEAELSPCYAQIPNRKDIFGEQIIYGSDDSAIGYMERMLIAPANITFDNLFSLTQRYGGAFVPAHVDRTSFSVMSNLGFLPPDLDIAAVEFTSRNDSGGHSNPNCDMFPGKKYIFSSDAHQLHIINERNHCLELPESSAKAMIEYLRNN